MKFLTAAFVSLLSCTAHARSSFLPPNNLDLEERTGGLTKAQFDKVIDRVAAIYGPIVNAHGANLAVIRDFNDPTVNAFADQPNEQTWEVHMFGGLAKRPEVSEDGFAMVMCHELGHHLGGYPYVGSTDFAANEGQADMHATGACASLVFAQNDSLERAARAAIPPKQQAQCDQAHSNVRDRNICYRAVVAGKSLADLLGSLEGSKVSFNTPDTSVVTTTNNEHPAAQCRLDTYLASALCGSALWDYSLIPGKDFADRNSLQAQTQAFQHSCTFGAGARPTCWFAAQ